MGTARLSFAGYLEFVRGIMGVPLDVLPDGSMYLTWSYETSVHLVNLKIRQADAFLYAQCVYNLAGDVLVNIAMDPPGAPIYKDGLPYWAWVRKQYGLNNFIAGTIASSSDEGTSQSVATIDQIKGLTLADLQNLKTPWGRWYLGIASSVGALFGMS